MSTPRPDIAFLFDVDNTLLDNDRVIDDLQNHLEQKVGEARAKCYWTLFEQLRSVFVRQDHYALDPKILADYPAADVCFDSIGELLEYDLAEKLNHEQLK